MKNTFKLKAILNNENVITLINGGDKSAFSFAVGQRFNKKVRYTQYPSISCGGYKKMSNAEIIEKVNALPCFKGEREPPDCLLLTLITSGCIIMLDP